jgi:hypothetical protein
MPELIVTVVLVGANAPADAVRLANVALGMAGVHEVRITRHNEEAGK